MKTRYAILAIIALVLIIGGTAISFVTKEKLEVAEDVTTYKGNTLGITFDYPASWGKIKEFEYKDLDNVTYHYFGKAFPIHFKVNSIHTVGSDQGNSGKGEDDSPLFQYAGQSFDDACTKGLFLSPSKRYIITVDQCDVRTSTGGVPYLYMKGSYVWLYDMDGNIPEDKRQPLYFEGALVQSKSPEWPGFIIDYITSNKDDTLRKKDFSLIADSLKYK